MTVAHAVQPMTQKSNSQASGLLLQRQCACGGPSSLTGECEACQANRLLGKPVQAKLQIGAANDAYEREADQAAEQVMRGGLSHSSRDLSPMAASSLVQRRQGDRSTNAGLMRLQRQEAKGEHPAVESAQQSGDGATKEDESPCPSWFGDPESLSKRAAENYVQNDMTPPSQATVERIDCEPPIWNGNYGCYVHFSDGLVIRVIVRKKDIVVGVPPINTLSPPPATPLCFYDYVCPEGLLVLTKRECKSARQSGPTMVAQRTEASGSVNATAAAPIVHEMLSSPGRPLDAATADFFADRFGHDFADVRVHADAKAAESAHSVNALAYTVGHDVVFGVGQYSPYTRAGQRLLAHELAHVVQQTGGSARAAHSAAGHRDPMPAVTAARAHASAAHVGLVQRQPKTDGPALRDLPIFLEKLEFDVGNNLLDYGHHLYQAAILHPDEPAVLQNALGRYALGLNVLKDSYRFAGFKPDTADRLALGTGILFKGLTFLRQGELTLDFQVDIGRGVKFETNVTLGVNPKDVTDVQKAGVNVGFVRRF